MSNDDRPKKGPRHRKEGSTPPRPPQDRHTFSFQPKGGALEAIRHNWHRPGVLGAIAGAIAVVILVVVVARYGSSEVPDPGPVITDRQIELAALPSFVIINSDDQRWDTLSAMPNVQELLAKHGVTFTNSFVVNPVCCPSRAALMTGSYSHTNGVYDNKGPEGGFFSFNDGGTLGTFVDQDYETGLFGKYLNNYAAAAAAGEVPRGWDRWVAFDREGYYDYALNEDGAFTKYGSKPEDYSITVLTDRITSFIEQTQGPLLVYYTPPTPHLPATYLPEDAKKFDKVAPWRPPSYDEADVSDKPDWVQRTEPISHHDEKKIDAFRIDQLRALQALDRSVADIVEALKDSGRLENTMIIYTSDNGMLWGEHRQTGKNVAYEESIRVPMVVRYDPWTSKARTDDHLIANIDIVPTIVEMAGAKAYKPDGMSMVPLLASGGSGSNSAKWRDAFLIEHYAERTTQKVPTFCAVRSDRFKLVDYSWGRDEFYDLDRDPGELTNLIFDASYANQLADMERELASLCQPKPPLSVDEPGAIP